MHPAWLRCESSEYTWYSCTFAPCQAGASTQKICEFILARTLSDITWIIYCRCYRTRHYFKGFTYEKWNQDIKILICEIKFFLISQDNLGLSKKIDHKPTVLAWWRLQLQSGYRINKTVRGRVLSIHVYESSPDIEEDYGHIGYKGRVSIQVLSLSFFNQGG